MVRAGALPMRRRAPAFDAGAQDIVPVRAAARRCESQRTTCRNETHSHPAKPAIIAEGCAGETRPPTADSVLRMRWNRTNAVPDAWNDSCMSRPSALELGWTLQWSRCDSGSGTGRTPQHDGGQRDVECECDAAADSGGRPTADSANRIAIAGFKQVYSTGARRGARSTSCPPARTTRCGRPTRRCSRPGGERFSVKPAGDARFRRARARTAQLRRGARRPAQAARAVPGDRGPARADADAAARRTGHRQDALRAPARRSCSAPATASSR